MVPQRHAETFATPPSEEQLTNGQAPGLDTHAVELVTGVDQTNTELDQSECRKFYDDPLIPLGWATKKRLANELGVAKNTIERVVDSNREEHPEWFQPIENRLGRTYEYYHPELVALAIQKTSEYTPAPEGWMTIANAAEILDVSEWTAKKILDNLAEHSPELKNRFKNQSGNAYYHYHSDLITEAVSLVPTQEKVPDDYCSAPSLARELGAGHHTVKTIAEKHLIDHPEWSSLFKNRGRVFEYYHPDLVQNIKEEVGHIAPEGWLTIRGLSKALGYSEGVVKKLAVSHRESMPEGVKIFRGPRGGKGARLREHYHPSIIDSVMKDLENRSPAPEGWITYTRLAKDLGVAPQTIRRRAEIFRQDHPEWFQIFNDSTRKVSEHFDPVLADELRRLIAEKNKTLTEERHGVEKQRNLISNLEDFLGQVDEGETLEAREFQALLQLFGSEQTVDILFQYRPEYRKVSLPLAKRVIGDYLGEFLVIRGDLQLETLELGTQYLSDPNLKQGLSEVIKNDCLKFYNLQRRNGAEQDDISILIDHINSLREQTAEYTTPELAEVLDNIEAYYRSLFEDISKPDNIVDELEPGRLFPDLNQRINIKELALKKKMLIADEMGVGKSASAILAKESLGVKQALVVVPSNVIEVWQKYLSDYRNGDGEAVGYFKEGQAPRVLIIDDLDSLDSINPADYDYVIISQERLTDKYTSALEQFDYDMMIVDETHKLKNITSGKRAENLVKLAERISGDDQYLALLSGTPVPNKVGDIAMVLKLLYPEKFEDVSNKELTRQILDGDVLDLRSLLVPRMQMKSLAESIEMPMLHEELHVVELSKEERDYYEVLLEEDELTASQKLQILRQFILNPEIFEATPGVSSSKIREVGDALQHTFLSKDKVVMFVNGYIEGVIRGEKSIFDNLNLPDDVEVQIIDGKVSKARRLEIQDRLRGHDGKILLAVSGQTADVGVDFSGAEELYFYNEPWTEYDKKQQQGRVYRPGLKQDLVSHTFYAQGTVEEGMHKYIEFKYNAIEKLLRGIPLSELERELLKQDEKQADPNLEVNPDLAEHYLSSWDRMLKIYNHVKEIGEQDFVKFLGHYGREYAECYTDLGSRSYQANAGRLSGTVIDDLVKSKGQSAEFVRIVDVASGPEMLKRHIGEEYQDQVVSIDINPHHFEELDDKRRIGSFLNLPVADSTVDYANLSLALHYSKFLPSKGNYERIEVFKELNRVLVKGGVAVINMMHTLDLKEPEVFRQAVEKMGFNIVDKYTGEVSSANSFKTRLLVLQKVDDCPQSTPALVQAIGTQLIAGFKFKKTDVKLRDSRRITTSFAFEDSRTMEARFNQDDQRVLEEEQHVLQQMSHLKRLYGFIQNIPREQIFKSGLSRAFTGKTYVLFKSLESGHGAVITR